MFEVRVLPPEAVGDRVRASALLNWPARAGDELWFELEGLEPGVVATSADAFVVATLAFAMVERCDLRVVGAPVSSSLHRNLEEFQQIWHAWFDFPVVELVAEDEREPDGPRPDPAVLQTQDRRGRSANCGGRTWPSAMPGPGRRSDHGDREGSR